MHALQKSFSQPSAAIVVAWAVIVAMSVIGAHYAYQWSERAGYEQLDATSSHQLDLYVAGLESELGKHQYLPSIMELDPDLIALLEGGGGKDLADKVNSRLASLNVRAGSVAVFAMDVNGIVRASSNWYQPGSLIGQDFSSVPYFREAIQEGQARFFSPNAAHDAPEYHFARPIRRNGIALGVAVAKISLAPVESTWTASISHSQNEKFVVVDEFDVIIISSVREWKYKPTTLLSAMLRARLSKPEERVPGVLEPLGMVIERPLNHGNLLVRLRASSEMSRDRSYVTQERYMIRPGWRLVTFSEASHVRQNARYAALTAAVLVAFVGLLGQYLAQRRRASANLLAARDALQAAHDDLERRITERTAELHDTNRDLIREIGERKRTEKELREAQDDLIQASKLAVLGQMSAGITHEINQPLTALRSLTHNTRLLLERGQTDRVNHNLQSISSITERMARITQQLKSFARKEPLTIGPILLSRSVENVLLLLDNRILSVQVAMQVEIPSSLYVLSDENRLEQVLINLLANAFDAIKESATKTLMLSASIANDRVLIRIVDSGPGIPDACMPHLFEPFFSSKPPGEGLGLGLAISAGIVREFGGVLRCENTADGTVFEFDLKLAKGENDV